MEERQNWCTKVELNFQVALVKDPQNVMALYQYALFLEEHLADLNQAVELYRRAARCFCANKHLQASVMCSLATALQRRGRLHIDSQVNIFSVREEEEEADKQGGGGGITQLNDLDEAAVWYERCLAVSPRSVACLCNFGMLQLFRNYPNKALKYFSRAIHMEPYNARALTAYAAVLDDVGMPINVVERMYMRAVQQDPDHVTALNGLGTVAHRQQKLAEAEIYYQRALTVDPSNDDVAENLEILREATYAHQGPKTPDRSKLHRERSQLSSRNDSRLPSRSGGLSPRMPSRGGLPPSPRATLQSRGRGFEDSTPSRLSSRDGPSYLHDRPCR